MQFVIAQEDPFGVLSSTKTVVENLQHIIFHEDNLDRVSKIISQKLHQGLESPEAHLGTTGNFIDDIQLIFLEDTVNFCFWAEKDKRKWQIEWPKGKLSTGGWYSLIKCFQRALAKNIPIFKAEYLLGLTLDKTQLFFMGTNGAEIPLIEKRLKNLQEAGKILKEKYDGEFINALETASFDAIEIVKLLLKDFTSFRDVADLDGIKIYFLKRAQICTQDLSSYLSQHNSGKQIKNIHLLTAFADYKIPQMLIKFGVIEYKKELGRKVDNYSIIPFASRDEIEIRSSTIWSIELIRQRLKKYTAADIDNALWLISQDQTNVKPYHRTYTIYY